MDYSTKQQNILVQAVLNKLRIGNIVKPLNMVRHISKGTKVRSICLCLTSQMILQSRIDHFSQGASESYSTIFLIKLIRF